MTLHRLAVLTLGPPLLVGAVYLVSFPASRHAGQLLAARIDEIETRAADARALAHDELAGACELAAEEVLKNLPANCRAVVHSPFVLAGDLNRAELERLYAEAVAPVAEALWRAFFDHRPDLPVTIVALSDNATYQAVAADLDGYEPSAYAGYTQRGLRRIVLNLETGRGTLAHELCHVLALFDFPRMPEWFDEGLAALHEEARFSPDGLLLEGQDNWRSRILREALAQNRLPSLETVIRSPEFRGEGEGLNYALVRGFCQYLEARGLLSHFYRKFHAAADDDPTGIATLRELLGQTSLDEIDRDFHKWLERATGERGM